jgi:hypothetical protein
MGDAGLINALHLQQRRVDIAKAHGRDERGEVGAGEGHGSDCAVRKEGENRPLFNPRKLVSYDPYGLLRSHIYFAINLYIHVDAPD